MICRLIFFCYSTVLFLLSTLILIYRSFLTLKEKKFFVQVYVYSPQHCQVRNTAKRHSERHRLLCSGKLHAFPAVHFLERVLSAFITILCQMRISSCYRFEQCVQSQLDVPDLIPLPELVYDENNEEVALDVLYFYEVTKIRCGIFRPLASSLVITFLFNKISFFRRCL